MIRVETGYAVERGKSLAHENGDYSPGEAFFVQENPALL
jgi:hypothetical protein